MTVDTYKHLQNAVALSNAQWRESASDDLYEQYASQVAALFDSGEFAPVVDEKLFVVKIDALDTARNDAAARYSYVCDGHSFQDVLEGYSSLKNGVDYLKDRSGKALYAFAYGNAYRLDDVDKHFKEIDLFTFVEVKDPAMKEKFFDALEYADNEAEIEVLAEVFDRSFETAFYERGRLDAKREQAAAVNAAWGMHGGDAKNKGIDERE